jgi:hypothetical protein
MRQSKKSVLFLLALAWTAVAPAAAYAQASIAGTVKDASGAVLPGVTVEAASPALIEKTRSVVTDGAGQYKIVDLRPGAYVVNFTLPGFNTVRRDGIELTGSFTASVNIDMKVGAVEETVTVTGEAPTVDVQGVAKQRVLGHDVLDTIPNGRNEFTMAVLVPGVVVASSLGGKQDVGGAMGDVMQNLVIHGSHADQQRLTIDGLSTASAEGSGQFTAWTPNFNAMQEMQLNVGAVSAEQQVSGVWMNMIPKDGGNTYKGSFFGTAVTGAWQGNNYTQDLKDRGLGSPDALKKSTDVSGAAGGPILRDKIWMFFAGRRTENENYVGGVFANLNVNNPNAWTYSPDLNNPGIFDLKTWDANGRITWQATPRNKFAVWYDTSGFCRCVGVLAGASPENIGSREYPFQRLTTGNWSAPVTGRLLLEAGVSNRGEKWRDTDPPQLNPSVFDTLPAGTIPGLTQVHLIGVLEQSNNTSYRSVTKATHTGYTLGLTTQVRASASYVTGSHAFKTGFQVAHVSRDIWQSADANNNLINYRFNNGTPNQITEYAKPYDEQQTIKADLGIYAQDKWTVKRMTANLGLRFDYFNDYFPAQTVGPGPLTPNRNISFPETPWVSWKDLSPRLGVAYDVRGDGRTALKASINRYVLATGLQGTFGQGSNPVQLLASTVTRQWNDTNKDFVPNCDLTNPLANGECGVMSDKNFGNATKTTAIDPSIVTGWGKRAYDWEFSAGVQQQVLPRVSVDFSFYRRWYGNFFVTDNLAVTPADFTQFSIVAPVDPRLPGGGGYTVGQLYDLNLNKAGQVNNLVTSAANYGDQIEHWNGFDLSVNARLPQGILLQGGLSTGKALSDNCAVMSLLPELAPVPTGAAGTAISGAATTNGGLTYCHQDSGWVTQVKLIGSYTIPKIKLQTSAAYQGLPGQQLAANFTATNAIVAPSLQRSLSGGSNVVVDLYSPGQVYGERLNQVDLRFAKVLPFRSSKTALNLDVYNLLNSSAVLVQNTSYAAYLTPQQILQARFVKFSVQFDF